MNPGNFNEKLKSFYDYDESLVIDGIINNDLFNIAKYKILWILKEPYGGGGFEYSEYINKRFIFGQSFPTSGPMWAKIIYINYGILNGFLKWDNINWLHEDENVYNSLKSCALINLKKIPGTTRSQYGIIKNHYEKCKSIITEQIELINPDIVICGGTFRFINESLNIDIPFSKDGSLGYIKENRLFINAYHPSYIIGQQRYCDEIISMCSLWASNINKNIAIH